MKVLPKIQKHLSLLIILIWLLTLGFILWRIWDARISIISYFEKANYSNFAIVTCAYVASLIASIMGWSTIMSKLDNSISWYRHAQIFALTLFGRRLPGTIWYVGGRMLLYERLGIPNKTIIYGSTLELLFAIGTGSLLGLSLSLPTEAGLSSIIISSIIMLGIISIFIIYQSTTKMWLGQIINKLIPKNISLKDILVWFTIYSTMWILSGLMLSTLIDAFIPIKPYEYIKITGIWALSGTVGLLTFFLPSTFGATEVTLTALLAQTIPLPLAGIIAILTRMLTTLTELILALAFYPMISRQFRSER